MLFVSKGRLQQIDFPATAVCLLHGSVSLIGIFPYADIQLIFQSATWHDTRVTLRQVSPESTAISDFILELHRACSGEWSGLCSKTHVPSVDLQNFLEYAATFLSNIGNYSVSVDYAIPHTSRKN